MDEIDTLTETERLLLMAAAVQRLGPSTDLDRANTARVVDQVLRWLGLSALEISRGWDEAAIGPIHQEVYNVLIRMTYQMPNRAPERPGTLLFEGAGNWGVPGDPTRPACLPQYNSCRLTAEGERLACELLRTFFSTHYHSGEEIRAGDRISWAGKPGHVFFVLGSSDVPQEWTAAKSQFGKENAAGYMLDVEGVGLVFEDESDEDLKFLERKRLCTKSPSNGMLEKMGSCPSSSALRFFDFLCKAPLTQQSRYRLIVGHRLGDLARRARNQSYLAHIKKVCA